MRSEEEPKTETDNPSPPPCVCVWGGERRRDGGANSCFCLRRRKHLWTDEMARPHLTESAVTLIVETCKSSEIVLLPEGRCFSHNWMD